MKDLLVVFFLLASLCFPAQTLTAADCSPVAGDIFKKKFVPGLVDPTDGQNMFWDYSNVKFMYNDIYTDSILSPASVPKYASLTYATHVRKTSGSPWQTEVFRATSDTLSSSIQGNLLYPLYLGKSWNSSNTYTLMNGGSLETVEAVFTGSVSASGTLITMAGTFPNTLKVKLMTVYSHSLNGTYHATRTWEYSNWYTYGFHDPVVSSRMVLSTLNEDYFYYTYFNLEVPDYTALEEFLPQSLTMYPVPADNILNINLGGHTARLVLYDKMGRCVFEQDNATSDFRILTSDLEPDLYFLKIFCGGKLISKKIVISH